MNDYEKAFLDRVAKLRISPGPEFAALTREAFEKEWGGQADSLLSGLNQQTLESPKKLASVLSKTYGDGALQYFTQIAKYAESGNFHPEEDQEQLQEEAELESVIQETGADNEESTGSDAINET